MIELIFHPKLLFSTLIFALVYFYLKFVVFSYWKKLGVPHDKATVPFGSINSEFLMKKINLGNLLRKSYEKFKNHPYHGLYIFHSPVLMINDLELVKQILVKDFSNFPDRGLFSNEKIDPLTGNLFTISGEKWRTLRVKLTPTFTSGKLKQMFPLLMEVADEMINVFDESLRLSDTIDVKDVLARYTTDTTFSLAFGIDSKTLKQPDSQFHHYGQLSYKQDSIRIAFIFFAPGVMNTLRIRAINPKVTEFFTKLFLSMIDKRKTESIKRNDFLNLLVELIVKEQIIDTEITNSSLANDFNAEKVAKKLDPMVAAAQSFVFFIGGVETTSSLMTHLLYELALNPDVQEKLQDEIDNHLQTSGVLNYENVKEMKYLDMVMNETARKHSPVPFLNRECKENYKIPNTNFIVPKGTRILIPVTGFHYDPNFYPDPEKFDPTRFDKQNTASRNPFSYLPFGEGPRICIGKRLGIMQSKVALVALLSRYKFSLCEKTKVANEYSTETFFQAPKGSLNLRVEKRKK